MDGRFNTIAGWVLGAGIVLLGANLVTHELFKAEHGNEFGYPVNGADEGASSGPAEQPIAFYLQTADAGRGERQFAKCSGCHTINQGGANGTGPNLYGIAGEQIATGRGGYSFSDALRGKSGETWSWDNLSAWLTSPRAFAPGTKMGFGGLANPQERADLLLYLNAQGGHLTVPPPPAAAPAGGNESAGNEAAPAGNTANAAAPAAGNAAAAAPAANAAAPAAH